MDKELIVAIMGLFGFALCAVSLLWFAFSLHILTGLVVTGILLIWLAVTIGDI